MESYAPPAAATSTEIELDAPTQAAPEDDHYSIVNQWTRLREEREARRDQALYEAQLRNEAAAAEAARQQAAAAVQPPRNNVLPGFFPYLGRGAPYYGYPGTGYPGSAGYGRGDIHPDAHRAARRGRDFSPQPVPAWPNQR